MYRPDAASLALVRIKRLAMDAVLGNYCAIATHESLGAGRIDVSILAASPTGHRSSLALQGWKCSFA